jgi:4-azaleucine resistance transporter AzlC
MLKLSESTSPISPPFTRTGLEAGVIGIWPMMPGLVMYGLAFGVLAATMGLSLAEALFFSGWVYAGGAQMASLQAWGDPIPIASVCLVTLAMNARYLLLGATLRPWFGTLPAVQAYPTLFVLGDGNWALAMRERAQGRNDAAVLLGSGIVMWLSWVSSTAAGHAFGQIMTSARAWGIDFMLTAYFATLAVAFLGTARNVSPLVIGVVTAIVVERLVPGPWYILSGALAGSIAGTLCRDPAR